MRTTIRVGVSTCGLAAGAEAVCSAIDAYLHRRQLPVTVQRTGCLGACHREPLVEVLVDGASTLYGPVTPSGSRRSSTSISVLGARCRG